MKALKNIITILVLFVFVIGVSVYGLFAVDILDVNDTIDVVQTNTYTVMLKREISKDMYAMVYVETPSLGRDDPEYVDYYMKYFSTSTYTLYKGDKVIATNEDLDCLSVDIGVDIYGENIRVVEDVAYFDEDDSQNWFSYKKSTKIALQGENAQLKGVIRETKDMTPSFVEKIKMAMILFNQKTK